MARGIASLRTKLGTLGILVLGACTYGRAPGVGSLDRDQQVYRAVLDSVFIPHKFARIGRFVILDSTSANARATAADGMFGYKALSADDSAATRDFEVRNQKPRSLGMLTRLRLPLTVELVNSSALKALRPSSPDPDEFWKRFNRIYSGAGGYLEFSSIGYNSKGDRAILTVAHSCGSLCGIGYTIVARRDKRDWRVVTVQTNWMS